MKNKKFLVGALVAAAIVVGGIAYFGTGANQQASVGNLFAKTTSPKVVKPVYDNGTYVGDNRIMPDLPGANHLKSSALSPQMKSKIDDVISKLNNLGNTAPSTSSKRKHTLDVYHSEDGYCAVFIDGHFSGVYTCD